METPLIPEKTKRKNDMVHTRGNVDLAFALVFIASLLMVFFKLDTLIGAVGLGAFYAWGSILFTLISALSLLAIYVNWGSIPAAAGVVIGILLLVLCGMLNEIITIAGLFTAILTVSLPAFTPLVLVVVTLLLWKFLRRKPDLKPIVLLYATGFFILAPASALGTGLVSSTIYYTDSIYVHGKTYYLQRADEWLGSSAQLTLYECNSLAVACEDVYQPEPDYYSENKSITLALDDANSSLLIYVNDNVVGDYPLPKE